MVLKRGIFLLNKNDTDHGIYMASSSAGKTLANVTSPVSVNNITGYATRFRMPNISTNGWIFEDASDNALMAINSSTGNTYIKGKVGIGVENTTFPLEIQGAGNGNEFSLKTDKNILCLGITVTSDRRIKENIQEINTTKGLELINKVKVKSYLMIM